jgi:hypothetical protein
MLSFTRAPAVTQLQDGEVVAVLVGEEARVSVAVGATALTKGAGLARWVTYHKPGRRRRYIGECRLDSDPFGVDRTVLATGASDCPTFAFSARRVGRKCVDSA